MNRSVVGSAVALAVVVGALMFAQRSVYGGPAIVIRSDGACGMVGADENGELTFGGIGAVTMVVENGNKVMQKCKGEGITNESGRAQTFKGFGCGVSQPGSGEFEEFLVTEDTHATVSASGVGTLTCTYIK